MTPGEAATPGHRAGAAITGPAYTELKTDRLFLRTLAEADAAVALAFGRDEFGTEAQALEWIRWVKEKNNEGRLIVNFYIWLAQTNRCVGRVYIHSKPELDGQVEIGYGIAEEYRNKGYATEAARAAVRYSFERAGQDLLVAIVKPENTPSQRVIEKLGFTRCGTRTVPDENGAACVFDYFQLPCSQWRALAR